MADPIPPDDINGLSRGFQSEANRRRAELEQIAANTSQKVARLIGPWGQFVENRLEPAVVRLFQERGIDIQETCRPITSYRAGAEMEIDMFAAADSVAVVIEVKTRLSQQDVEDFLAKLGRFKQAFPHQASYQIYGAIAGIEIAAGVDRYADQQGLFVIEPTGDTVAIANHEAFRPTAW